MFACNDRFDIEMQAIDLKEEAQRLQREGRYEEALPLMKRSVALRETSHTLCLTLSELADLYVDMLKLDEADAACHRMLREAHRYDEANQRRIAKEILEESAKEREMGIEYGMPVQTEGLTSRTELNGKEGVVKGKIKDNGRYVIQVGTRMLSLNRRNFNEQAHRVVQLSVPEQQGESWVFRGTRLDGNSFSPIRLGHATMQMNELRREFARQLCCQPSVVRLVFPNGVAANHALLKQLCLQLQSQSTRKELGNHISKEKRKECKEIGKNFGKLGGIGGKLGGNNNNEKNSERRLAAAQACETCTECGRMLPHAQYWPADWRHRTSKAIACKECRPAMPNKRPRGGGAANQQRAAEAAERPITCKVCQRALPRSHFRPAANGKYYLTKGLTCEQCRAGGKLDKGGRKRKHSEED